MDAPYIAVGLAAVLLWSLVCGLDRGAVFPCSACGLPGPHPVHYAFRLNSGPLPHHVYEFPGWPYGLAALLMVGDVVAWVVR
jgi:hypothetical protein